MDLDSYLWYLRQGSQLASYAANVWDKLWNKNPSITSRYKPVSGKVTNNYGFSLNELIQARKNGYFDALSLGVPSRRRKLKDKRMPTIYPGMKFDPGLIALQEVKLLRREKEIRFETKSVNHNLPANVERGAPKYLQMNYSWHCIPITDFTVTDPPTFSGDQVYLKKIKLMFKSQTNRIESLDPDGRFIICNMSGKAMFKFVWIDINQKSLQKADPENPCTIDAMTVVSMVLEVDINEPEMPQMYSQGAMPKANRNSLFKYQIIQSKNFDVIGSAIFMNQFEVPLNVPLALHDKESFPNVKCGVTRQLYFFWNLGSGTVPYYEDQNAVGDKYWQRNLIKWRIYYTDS